MGLTLNIWENGNLSSGQVDWYKITPGAAGVYSLQWDDQYNSSGGNTLAAYVSAYRAGDGTPVFTAKSNGYAYPVPIGVSAGETIYVLVEGQESWTGTYALKYYQGTTGGDEYPFILSPDSNTLTVNIMSRGDGVTGYLPTDPECDTWDLQNDANKGRGCKRNVKPAVF